MWPIKKETLLPVKIENAFDEKMRKCEKYTCQKKMQWSNFSDCSCGFYVPGAFEVLMYVRRFLCGEMQQPERVAGPQ